MDEEGGMVVSSVVDRGGELDDEADCLTWRGEESHKSPVASSECHTAPDLAENILLCGIHYS